MRILNADDHLTSITILYIRICHSVTLPTIVIIELRVYIVTTSLENLNWTRDHRRSLGWAID